MTYFDNTTEVKNLNWNRWGQSDPTYSQAKANSTMAEAEARAARARDLHSANKKKEAEKPAKENKNK